MSFGIKLQNLRKEQGLSQEVLAERLDVSRQSVSKWERDEVYPEIDKLILLSDMFHVSLDYLIKDESSDVENKDERYFLNHQDIKDYISFKKQFAFRIAAAVMMIVLSVNVPIMFADTRNENLAAALMLMIIALAVAVLIITGLSLGQYEDLEKKEISMGIQDGEDLKNQFKKFRQSFGIYIAFGVCLIIIAVAMSAVIDEYIHNENISGIVLLTCVAIAVFIFIYQGIVYGMYQFLVKNKEFVMEKRKEEKTLFAFTMPLAAMIYLVMGFTRNWWHPGWIVFTVAAIITLGIENMMEREK